MIRCRLLMWCVLILIGGLTACGGDAPPELPPTLQGAVVPTRITRTPLPSHTPTSTLTPTNTQPVTETPVATDTPTVTETSTPTITPSLTPTNTAPPPTAIHYGDTIDGFIDDESSSMMFYFDGDIGDVVTIEMTKTDPNADLDPYLILISPDGETVAFNDDRHEDDLNATIEAYELPQTGRYTLVATRYQQESGVTTGAFTLTLMNDTDATARLVMGETATARITNAQPEHRYTFYGNAGDTINIRLDAISGTLDPLVILLSPNGEELIRNDDAPGRGQNAFINNFTLPSDGVYTIIATRYALVGGTSEGDFELAVVLVGQVDPNIVNPPAGSVLTFGQPIQGEITQENFAQVYFFEGRRGQVISVLMETVSGNLDPYLILVAPNGQEIARNDDYQNLNAGLDNIQLQQDGVYQIVASRYNLAWGTSTGTFRLGLRETDGITQAAILAIPIRYDSLTLGEITSTVTTQVYTFEGRRGDRITVNVEGLSPDMDLMLSLQDSYGHELIRNYDNLFDQQNVFNSRINDYILPDDGFYSILVDIERQNYGEFSLSLTLQEAAVDNPPIYGLLHPLFSSGLSDDGDTLKGYMVGDWVFDGQERRMGSILTYQLPELPADQTIDYAQLNLGLCYLTNNQVFTQFGRLTVWVIGRFAEVDQLQLAFRQSSAIVDELDSCRPVDITRIVQASYAGDLRYIQFQLGFLDVPMIENGAPDGVVMLDPRLEIFVRGE